MNAISAMGLSSCRMMSPAPSDNAPQAMLRLADHCPEEQPFAFREFVASSTAVVPTSQEQNPLSLVAASHRRDQAKRRQRCRAA